MADHPARSVASDMIEKISSYQVVTTFEVVNLIEEV